MKTEYSYTVLRYIHDISTGEFVNIGVVLYAPAAKYLGCRFSQKYSRLTRMFLDVDGKYYRKAVKHIDTMIEKEHGVLKDELELKRPPKTVSGYTNIILPPDDSSLQFAQEGQGLTSDPERTLEQLFFRFVEKYVEKKERNRRSEVDVWKTFREPFRAKHIYNKFSAHDIVATSYAHNFKHCLKNGKWHIQEPISFDLADSSSIKEKANIWLGRMTSLEDSKDDFKMNMLIGKPQDARLRKACSDAIDILHKMKRPHEIIEESEAEAFAEELSNETLHSESK